MSVKDAADALGEGHRPLVAGQARPRRVFAAARSSLWLLALGGVFTFVHAGYVAVTPLYLLRHGYATATVGLVTSALLLGTLSFRVVVANLVDRWPERRLMGIAIAVLVAASVGMLLVPPGPWLALPRFAQGVAMSAFFTTAFAALGRRTTPANRGAQFGRFSFVTAVTLTVAPSAALWAYGTSGLSGLVGLNMAAAALGVLAMLLAWGPPNAEEPEDSSREAAAPANDTGGPARRLSIVTTVLAMSMLASVLGVSQAYIPLIAVEKSFHQLGPLYVAYGVGLSLGRLLGGRASDRFGRRKVAVLSCNLLLGATVGAYFGEGVAYGLMMAGLGFGLGSANSALLALLADVAAGRNQGRILGLSMIVPDVAASAFVTLDGVLAGGRGLATWPLAIALSAAALITAALTMRRTPRAVRPR